VGGGPRATEAQLFTRLDALADEARREPSRLARPVVVVVPSTSLRDHLSAAWLARRGRAAAGVQVSTLFALALDLLGRAGERAPRGGAALEVLVRRFARSQPALAATLAGFRDGFGVLAGTVRDLLDAGFSARHLAACDELLAARGDAASERGRAILCVAAATGVALGELGLERTGAAYQRAALALGREPALLSARAVLIHGFADATGLALDLLEELRRAGAELFLDLPSGEPAASWATGAGFTERLALRLTGALPSELPETAPTPALAPAVRTFQLAADPWQEARAAAEAVRRALDDGVPAERIGLVARDLAPYRLPLEEALGRLALPFSAPGTPGSPGAAERRAAALLELVSEGPSVALDRWLEAAGRAGDVELRLGLASLGLARLAQVAQLDVEAATGGRDLPLPLAAAPAEDGDAATEVDDGSPAPAARKRRRYLAVARLRQAHTVADRLVRHLERWPGQGGRPAALSAHLAAARQLLARELGWIPPETEPAHGPWAALEQLEGELPAALPLGQDELALLWKGALAHQPGPRWGGAGAGVQVLSATEARGRTFERLHVLGLSAGLFPRPISEDPLFPDELRGALLLLLPDLPMKGLGRVEELYLVRQLGEAAPEVAFSAAQVDASGRRLAPSPLLDRLAATPLPRPPARATPRSAVEWLVAAGLEHGREAFAALWPVVTAGSARTAPTPFQRAVLDELDPDLGTVEGRATARRLGPWLGLVGGGALPAPPFVTTLEAQARCAWQSLLTRELGLAPLADPWAALPELSALAVGNVLHGALERAAAGAGVPVGTGLEALAGRAPAPLALPTGAVAAELLAAVALEVAHEEGAPWLARALARRARAGWEVLRLALGEQPRVLGAELTGEVQVGRATLGFRADLALASEPLPTLLDLKTGRPFLGDAARPPEPARALTSLAADAARGRRLQAIAYALATAAGPWRGGYLFAGEPGWPWRPEERLVPLGPDELPTLGAAFAGAVETLLAARALGAFAPRLLDASLEKEGEACRSCAVREACLQGDSGARARLVRWLEADGLADTRAAAAARAGLRLGLEPPAGRGEAP
jgi:hypothetical protein